MNIVCPNDTDHKRFCVTAHVTEEWIVNENGLLIKVSGSAGDVLHRPDAEDYYTCTVCNSEAEVLK